MELIESARNLINIVRSLNLPLGQYVVVNGGSLGVRGLRDWADIDVVVSAEVFDKLKASGAAWEACPARPGMAERVQSGKIDIWRRWAPGAWDLAKLIGEAEIIECVPFVQLSQVLKYKKLRCQRKDICDIKLREKDRQDVWLIEQYLQAQPRLQPVRK